MVLNFLFFQSSFIEIDFCDDKPHFLSIEDTDPRGGWSLSCLTSRRFATITVREVEDPECIYGIQYKNLRCFVFYENEVCSRLFYIFYGILRFSILVRGLYILLTNPYGKVCTR